MKNQVKEELNNYRSEIVASVLEDSDLNWLHGRALDSLLSDVRSEFDSVLDDIKNINTGDLENEIREDCALAAQTEALETLGARDEESITPADESFYKELEERILDRLVKEKMPDYIEREVRKYL